MLHKIQDLFMRLVRLVEEHPAPLRRYFQLYFAILAVRLTLEFFSSHRLFGWADVVHIGLWFMFIVLAFLLQLHLFSGERIAKVTKLCIVGFTIALTAPIIDLLLKGGVGAKMNYLSINSWADIPYAYFTMGGQSLTRGATLGIRIEIMLLVIASFNYVRIKRKSILWGLASACSIYTVLVVSGMVPWLLDNSMRSLGLVYGPEDQSTPLLLLTLDVFLLGACLYRYAPQTVRLILRTVPWGTVALAVCLFGLGAGLARQAQPLNWALNPTTLFSFPLLLALGGCMATLLGLQHLQIKGLLQAPSAEKACNFLIALSLGMALMVDVHMAFVVAAWWGVLFLLNEPPLNLRLAPLLRNLMESMALVLVALLGFTAFGGPMVGFPMEWLIPLLAAQMLGGLWTDLLPNKESVLLWFGTWGNAGQQAYRIAVLACYAGGHACVAYGFLPGWAWLAFLLWSGLMAGWLIWGKRAQGTAPEASRSVYASRISWLIWLALPIYIALAVCTLG